MDEERVNEAAGESWDDIDLSHESDAEREASPDELGSGSAPEPEPERCDTQTEEPEKQEREPSRVVARNRGAGQAAQDYLARMGAPWMGAEPGAYERLENERLRAENRALRQAEKNARRLVGSAATRGRRTADAFDEAWYDGN